MSEANANPTPKERRWEVVFSDKAEKALAKLDRPVQKRIRDVLDAVAASGLPRGRGHSLTGNLAGLWRYRVGDYRIIVDIQDARLVIVALDIGHRSGVYRNSRANAR